ncbi:26S proteasome non-ATPase regulatory subunit 10-like [Mizuhopecten yessoensis]|uniref:Serine/threonine-protein phosphatase 6 regulatory ankyrin repeat subunit B n=1 Tax=Mizuhopecten yessoensis TaxID=6573 RepID=A0A210PGF7_MIZYE|nr:26S proteasome non-ATPase regulatory subunit 10-like [Mizuhopecten yessoensis]XP_021342297.1 26S proteasome non-ATPase regulatory subunit 10-like [Mizuhopecten yessoensis]OWF35541.1 Serine/threonine-protein phosphatase 6 regulatory ankyrin repeat subunit B [Mizuhopecten yessoensis]
MDVYVHEDDFFMNDLGEQESESEMTDEDFLLRAIEKHDLATAQNLLCIKGVSPNFERRGKNPICRVAYLGQEDMLELLISNQSFLSRSCHRDSMWLRQPIHLAASKGHQNIVQRLVECGVDINSKDSDHRTPLHWTATYGRVDTAQLLLQKGAVVNVTQTDGFTPLHIASCLGHLNVCRVLIENGAEVNRVDAEGWTALHTAVCYGKPKVVELLLENQAAVKAVTLDQNTTLHVAASSGYLSVIKILLTHDLDLNRKNMQGFTPFHLAFYHSKVNACRRLIKHGVDIQTCDCNGQTPLYIAASQINVKLVHILLEAGYDFSKEKWIRDKKFPFDVQKQSHLSELLIETASNPRSLQHLGCFRIRNLISGYIVPKVERLPIPKSLIDMLAFKSQ